MITAFASGIGYRGGVPMMGGHADLTEYQPTPTNNYVRNHCSEVEEDLDETLVPSDTREWDFWVDQDGNGQVFSTRTISKNTTVTAQYSKTLTSGQVKLRGSTRGLLESRIYVEGTIDKVLIC